jgi:hypothetical protein
VGSSSKFDRRHSSSVNFIRKCRVGEAELKSRHPARAGKSAPHSETLILFGWLTQSYDRWVRTVTQAIFWPLKHKFRARSTVVDWRTMLETGRWSVRFTIKSMDVFNWRNPSQTSSNRNKYQESYWNKWMKFIWIIHRPVCLSCLEDWIMLFSLCLRTSATILIGFMKPR